MASARHLCQHSDSDGIQCTLDDYLLCPHCQLQLCLKHINHHQDLLHNDLNLLCDNVNRVRSYLDHLKFDALNRRQYLFTQLDEWRLEQIAYINKIHNEKKERLNILCLQAQMEFETYKTTKDSLLKIKITKPINRLIKQKQIQNCDINEMKRRLEGVERGLDQLQQLLIDINLNSNNSDINFRKRSYIEAAQPLVIDDEDDFSDADDDDESERTEFDKTISSESTCISQQFFSPGHLTPSASPPDIIFLSSPSSPPPSVASVPSPPSSPPSTTLSVKKAPLKMIIKRLQQPTTTNGAKYRLRTVATASPLMT